MTSPPGPPEPAGGEQILQRAAVGARLLTARGIGIRLVSVASNLALIALVAPAELGLLAVVRGITALAGNTTDLGFAWALLRRRENPSREEYGALAGVQLAIVLALLALVAVKPLLLSSIGAVPPQWIGWMLAVMLTTLVVPFGTSARIRIERSLDYRKIAFYEISTVLLQNLALLGFAAAGRFPLGVFIATGGAILYSNLLLWIWSPGPAPSFRLRVWRGLAREFAGFSSGHLAGLLYQSATPLIVANLFGLSGAGIWSLATRLGNVLQVAFEGFRRAAVPAAALVAHSRASLLRLAESSLTGAARLTVPLIAAVYAGLPVIGLLRPQWAPAIRTGQIYALSFGLAGLVSASVVPVAVALHGARIVLAEQLAPMVTGWIGLLVLHLLHRQDIAWVVLPMHLALVAAVILSTDRDIRPRWTPELTNAGAALGAVVLTGTVGEALHGSPLVIAVLAAAVFVGVWTLPRLLVRARVPAQTPTPGWE